MAERHPMQDAYDREAALPRFRGVKLSNGWAVNYAPLPTLNDSGTMSSSMRFPIVYAWEGLDDPEAVVTKIAEILEREWGKG